MKQIAKGIIQGLGKIGEETGKELVKETAKIGESLITGKELLGDIKPMTTEEMAKMKVEEEKKKKEEMAKLKSGLEGRAVETEINEIRKEKKREEEEKERKFLEDIKKQREAEEAERQSLEAGMAVSSNPAKRKKSRGSAFVTGKKQGVSQSQQSQTGEYKGKVD